MSQDKELSPKWRARFDFFDSVGGDITSPEYRKKIKEISFFGRMKYIFNFFAFFFGIIYMCILGLWKKGAGTVCRRWRAERDCRHGGVCERRPL